MERPLRVYLASPLGFSPENSPYLAKVKDKLRDLGAEIIDPWETAQRFQSEIDTTQLITDQAERTAVFRRIAAKIGQCNEDSTRDADIVFAILDGAEVDSGTASEVGFGAALGKWCYGLRTDFRDMGDLPGCPINLQVLHFIERQGGMLFRTIDEISFEGINKKRISVKL